MYKVCTNVGMTLEICAGCCHLSKFMWIKMKWNVKHGSIIDSWTNVALSLSFYPLTTKIHFPQLNVVVFSSYKVDCGGERVKVGFPHILENLENYCSLKCPGKVLEFFSNCPGTLKFWLKCLGKAMEFPRSMKFKFLWQSSSLLFFLMMHALYRFFIKCT